METNAQPEYRLIEPCSISGNHTWRDDECTKCGARIRRDLPTRDQVRAFHAAKKSVRS